MPRSVDERITHLQRQVAALKIERDAALYSQEAMARFNRTCLPLVNAALRLVEAWPAEVLQCDELRQAVAGYLEMLTPTPTVRLPKGATDAKADA